MRIILIISAILISSAEYISAQKDFKTLDKQSYDYFTDGNYKNLKNTADTMFSQGIDYYYLRMRIGILSYNKQLYSNALRHFTRALEFNSWDTLSLEYIYYSYLFSGRKADANLFLESIATDKKNSTLKSIGKPGLSDIFISATASGYDVILYNTNNLYYEAVENSLSLNAGFNSYFSSRLKGTFAFTNLRKTGTVYSASDISGKSLNFTQNQVYAKLTGFIFPGWEISGFGHIAFYPDLSATSSLGNGSSAGMRIYDYIWGMGISKNGWKIRTGADFSLSNFSYSRQIRGEGYLTWLPSGNLNLYFTSGGMYQNDKYWGATYQINQEIGLRVFKSLWLESGIIIGNSFLYTRNQGYMMNNSFLIPAATIYSNIIILPGKHLGVNITPFYTQNQNYSWDLNAYTRTNKLTLNSFGGVIKLNYKFR